LTELVHHVSTRIANLDRLPHEMGFLVLVRR
jgi:hypothetical protein